MGFLFSFTEIRTDDLNFAATSFLVYSDWLSADLCVKKGVDLKL